MGNLPRVLCVDDSEDIGELVGRAIERRHDLAFAGYLPDATRLREEAADRRADVVILDLSLPGTDVFEAIRMLRTEPARSRVLVYSGYDDPGIVRSAMESGASAFVCKTAAIDDLLDVASKVASDVLG